MKLKEFSLLPYNSPHFIVSHSIKEIRGTNDEFRLYLSGDYFIIQDFGYLPNGDELTDQQELPNEAASWILDRIENGFRKSSDEGGLPPGVMRDTTTINDETIHIRYTLCAGGDGVDGITIISQDRKSHINERNMQESVIPSQVLDETLIPFLRTISARLKP
ncbi:hypothetical protein P0Y67_22210 [Photobacterium sp. SP02]|uniref:hypothetical protein n=1 Tax=Photobacterium sp. SP02 TaxID=3032280 RepID=UPI003144E3C1